MSLFIHQMQKLPYYKLFKLTVHCTVVHGSKIKYYEITRVYKTVVVFKILICFHAHLIEIFIISCSSGDV